MSIKGKVRFLLRLLPFIYLRYKRAKIFCKFIEGLPTSTKIYTSSDTELSDYDYRLNIGPGLGYKLIEDEIQTVDIQGGLDYAYDKYKTGTKDNYLAGRTELNYKYKFSENLDFKQMISYLASFEDANKYFVVSDSSLEVNMTKNLSLGVSYNMDYTNQTEKEKLDKKFLTSLIVDF